MKIAMFASESNPLVKTGGLADVIFSLSEELAEKGNEVVIALPYYKTIKPEYKKSFSKIGSFTVSMSWRRQIANIYRGKIGKITFYLIGNDFYFGRDRVYGYNDDGERFAFFDLSCRALLPFISFKADIIHVHDHQAAMIPVLIKEKDMANPIYRDAKFVLTIHNPAFKGLLDRFFVSDYFGLDDSLYDSGKLRFEGAFSTLKSGIIYADKITTVSPSHRNELLESDSGHGLQDILRLREMDFAGFLNGIDYDEWNPATDKKIAKTYTAETIREGRKANQEALLKKLGIVFKGGPVYGLVSRLTWQKGIDLVLRSGRKALERGANLIILGSGEYKYEAAFEDLRREFPDTCAIYIGYSDLLAHEIYAGCDFFLMPSLFEPCGISQLISKRYGCLPIVRYTGGLKDTVNGYNYDNEDTADGVGFINYDEQGLDYGIEVSRNIYANEELYYKIIANAMAADHSWKATSELYLGMYRELTGK
ncbi:MAG: glycogen synthase [Bacilli bacterium]|nr:glycogen synthase [Bacilli bacterium]